MKNFIRIRLALLASAIIFSVFSLYSQTYDFSWVTGNTCYQASQGYDITLDGKGNTCVSGNFGDSAVFKSTNKSITLHAKNWSDGYVAKLDENGELLWVRGVGGSGYDVATNVAADAAGNVFIAGIFSDSGDFDPGNGVHMLYSNGDKDIFIVKLDPDGKFLWAGNIGGSQSDEVFSITSDPFGNLIIGGYYKDNADLDPSDSVYMKSSSGDKDGFLIKINPDGKLIWAVTLNSPGQNDFFKIISDVDGNIYSSGNFAGTVDFDPGAGVYNLQTPQNYTRYMYLSKLDSGGKLSWAKSFPSTSSILTKGLSSGGNEHLWLAAQYSGTFDADPGSGTASHNAPVGFAPCLIKLDTSGNYIWSRDWYKAGSNIRFNDIATDALGNTHITGILTSTADMDPGNSVVNLNFKGVYDIFLLKMDSAGKYVHAIQLATYNEDHGNAVACNARGDAFLTGSFDDTMDFDPGPGTKELIRGFSINTFVARYNRYCTTTSTLTETHCISFTSPSGKHTYYSSGTYYDTLQNQQLCDSIITIQLTIKEVDTSVIRSGNILTSAQSGATYRWLNCTNNYAFTGTTSQSFIPSSSGDYAVEITFGGCTDTSLCFNVQTTDIKSLHFLNANAFPNPGDSYFELPGHIVKVTNVYTLTGQFICTIPATENKFETSSLHKGTYLITGTSESGIIFRFFWIKE